MSHDEPKDDEPRDLEENLGDESRLSIEPEFPMDSGEYEPAIVIPRSEHSISRRDIDPDALRVLYHLHRSGCRAYLVGGGVRDLMLGRTPKDFDIATDARPRRLKKMFRNCRIIGRRFRLAHLHFPGDKIIEVATFRSSSENDAIEREGELIRRDNVFGTPHEDARRRDLTINGLFYNIADFSVIDYVGGVDDLRRGIVRTIGDPVQSFREDPVRMLRALRHATRLGFALEAETHEAILSEREEILKANESRLLEELYKDLSSGCARPYFETLQEYKLLKLLIPELYKTFRRKVGAELGREMLFDSLDRLDRLHQAKIPLSNAVGVAALFAPLILPVVRQLEQSTGVTPIASAHELFAEALKPAFQNLRIYRRDEERLWQLLSAWSKVSRAFQKNEIPPALARRHYFREAAELFGLIEDESPELESFLNSVRLLPPADEEPEHHRRGSDRPPRSGRPVGSDGSEATADEGTGPRVRRRRRRRKQSRHSGRSAASGTSAPTFRRDAGNAPNDGTFGL
ncbi:MAG: polynucleotide adenylyltransferase PcnB [Planctomycetota bacterium]